MATEVAEDIFKDAKTPEDMDKVLRDNLGVGISDCTEALSKFILERGSELLDDMINMAPYGDYGKLTEDKGVILKFLQEEAIKPNNWELQFVEVKKGPNQLLELVFFNKSVDDGDFLKGFVFLGISGKIRHAFVQAHS